MIDHMPGHGVIGHFQRRDKMRPVLLCSAIGGEELSVRPHALAVTHERDDAAGLAFLAHIKMNRQIAGRSTKL